MAEAKALRLTPREAGARIWRTLASTRLALILILLLALATLIGTVVIQAPSEVQASPTAYERWAKGLGSKYGVFTGFFDALGFYRVFSTFWFRGLGALLGLNILVCTLDHLPRRWRQALGRPPFPREENFYLAGRHRSHFQAVAPPEAAARRLETLLHRRRYRALAEAGSDQFYLYADRYRLTHLSTLLTHSGLVLFLVVAVLGGLWRQEATLTIPDGSVQAVGLGTNLYLLNEGFVEEDYPSGVPMDYRSDLVLYDGGIEVARKTIRVNDPLKYQGLRFHQSFFGNAPVLSVKDDQGAVLFQDAVALAYRSDFWGPLRPTGYFDLFGEALWVEVVGTAINLPMIDPVIHTSEVGLALYQAGQESSLFMGKLALNEPQEIGGLEFTFLREKQYTGITVARNPVVNYLWLASGLIVAGTILCFYFPHRRLWALVKAEGGATQVRLRGAAPRLARFDGEFQRLAADVGRELGQSGPGPTG